MMYWIFFLAGSVFGAGIMLLIEWTWILDRKRAKKERLEFEKRKPEATDPERQRRQHSRKPKGHARQSTAHLSGVRHIRKSE